MKKIESALHALKFLGTKYEVRIRLESGEEGEGDFLSACLFRRVPEDGWSDHELEDKYRRVHEGDRFEPMVEWGVSASKDDPKTLVKLLEHALAEHVSKRTK